jgi:hypothetical protein
MAATTAPTITIDGVTSRPGSPISMLALACDCHPVVEGHDLAAGDPVECEEHGVTTVIRTLETWMF